MPPSLETDAWTTRRLLGWMTDHFASKGIESPRVVAEMLLAHVLGCERLHLYMEADRPAAAEERQRLRDLARRAAAGEPVHYLTGSAAFYWRSFEVNRTTLIPQPSTETLVEAVIGHVQRRPDDDLPVRIADIGTGTGAIAVSLAAHLPGARLIATDISPEILELAARNARIHGVAERIELRLGSLLEPLRGAEPPTFDVICSNPPYIPSERTDLMDPGVREHVPASAWDGGPDGLRFVGPLIAEAGSLLVPGGLLTIEIDASHGDAARSLAGARSDLDRVEILDDHEGLPRVLTARRREGGGEGRVRR